MVETAINQMNERIKEKPVVPSNPFQHLFMQQQAAVPQQPPQPMIHPSVHMPIHQVPVNKPSPPVPEVDTKVLDRELSEELKELDVSVEKQQEEPEGRVDVIPEPALVATPEE